MTQLEARQVKAVELDILTELDRVCREHQLSYALAYGTLIGAMRHSGFIPWDDDIDVYMPRDDYEKLYDLWKQGGLGEHYSLVSYRDRTSINSYCKLVDTRTRAVESFLDESAGNLGLWVDIFPLERVDITDPAVHRAARRGAPTCVVEVHRGVKPALRNIHGTPHHQVHALSDDSLRRPVRHLSSTGRACPRVPPFVC